MKFCFSFSSITQESLVVQSRQNFKPLQFEWNQDAVEIGYVNPKGNSFYDALISKTHSLQISLCPS